jgi:hypothetical protein
MIRETVSNDRDGPIHHMARETGPCILALLSRTETLESCPRRTWKPITCASIKRRRKHCLADDARRSGTTGTPTCSSSCR